jgi:ATP-binding cassette subfamily G (WHITE) protein 2 (SNQ2)
MQVRTVLLRRVQIIGYQYCVRTLVPFIHGMLTISLAFRSFVLQGIITGSVFVNSPESTSAFFSRGGVMFL